MHYKLEWGIEIGMKIALSVLKKDDIKSSNGEDKGAEFKD